MRNLSCFATLMPPKIRNRSTKPSTACSMRGVRESRGLMLGLKVQHDPHLHGNSVHVTSFLRCSAFRYLKPKHRAIAGRRVRLASANAGRSACFICFPISRACHSEAGRISSSGCPAVIHAKRSGGMEPALCVPYSLVRLSRTMYASRRYAAIARPSRQRRLTRLTGLLPLRILLMQKALALAAGFLRRRSGFPDCGHSSV